MKKKLLIIIIIFLTLFIILKNNNSKQSIFYIKNDGLYSYKNKIKKVDNYLYTDIKITDNDNIIYIDHNNLYLHKKGKKKKLIAKNVYNFEIINNNYFIYLKNDKYIIYNIMKNKKNKITITNGYKISNNRENLLLMTYNTLKVFNIKKQKVIKTMDDIIEYNCINDSCTKVYYINTKQELKKSTSKKIIDKNVNKILDSNKNSILYIFNTNGEYKLKYKKKFKKSIILDTNNKSYFKGIINDNKIHFISSGVYKTIKLNGKHKKIITKDVDDFIDIYKGKMLLIKNKDLYIDNKLISEFVNTESVIIHNNKIYYLKVKEDIPSLYSCNGNKEKLIEKNVGEIVVNNNKLYYLGNYNISQKYGNIYKLNSKKVIDKKVTRIIHKDK